MSEREKINKIHKSKTLAYLLWAVFGAIGAAHYYSETTY